MKKLGLIIFTFFLFTACIPEPTALKEKLGDALSEDEQESLLLNDMEFLN